MTSGLWSALGQQGCLVHRTGQANCRDGASDGYRPRQSRHHPRQPLSRKRPPGAALRHPGAGAHAAGTGAAGSPRRAAHRRPRFRLSRLPAWRARSGALEARETAGRARHQVPARPERGPRRHHAARRAADRLLPGQEVRRRLHALVRERPRRRSLGRRAALRQHARHGEAWRRARGGGRRSRRAFLHLSAPDRPDLRDDDDAGAASRRLRRDRPARARGLRAFPLLRPLGRAQDDRRDGRAGAHRHHPRRAPLHPARLPHPAARPQPRPDAALAGGTREAREPRAR